MGASAKFTNQQRWREAALQVLMQPRNLAKSLSRFAPGAVAQGLTVLAVDGQWLKLLQVEGPLPARRITKLLVCPVAGVGAEELVKLFREACATEGVAPREVLIANPTHLSTVRLFSLPSTDPREIRDIVELQAEKHTPYAKEEILTDFRLVAREASGYSRVLLIIAHQDVIHRPVRLIEASGWVLERVGCELEGLMNWFQMVRRGAAASGEASLIVEVDASTTTVLVMQRGQPQFHRSLATGAEQLVDDPSHAGERLVGELQRSLESLEAEGASVKIHEVLLTGRVERLGEFRALIEQGLQANVSVLPAWGEGELSETARAAYERLPDVSFASLVGLAVAPSQINLTPQATKLRQVFEEKARSLVLVGCQAVAALILVSLLVIARAQKEQRYYQKLRGFYEHSAQEAFRVEEALRQTELVKARMRRRGELLGAMATLAKFSPEGIQWQAMTYTQHEQVILKGTSEELPKVYEFVAGLDGLPLFEHVETKRVAKRKSGDRDLSDFEISCPFVVAKTERDEAAPVR